jgi:hypothetical protein
MFVDDSRFLFNREQEQETKFNKFAHQIGDRKLAVIEIGAGQGVPIV